MSKGKVEAMTMQLFSWLDLSHLGHFHHRSTWAATNLSGPSLPARPPARPPRHPPSIDHRCHCQSARISVLLHVHEIFTENDRTHLPSIARSSHRRDDRLPTVSPLRLRRRITYLPPASHAGPRFSPPPRSPPALGPPPGPSSPPGASILSLEPSPSSATISAPPALSSSPKQQPRPRVPERRFSTGGRAGGLARRSSGARPLKIVGSVDGTV
ncbi:hypothetical protein MPTK1_8g06080 [Marchantia polymorpha subsp. ruderalis]|uniref:Uncharacterized protein n=1 Tax=Marchantia polymorpha TaxID=3197 RepID=A0A2R6XIP5_MARPO|nr:hypothetical protein MARPO_0013s0182 [Marchantia polymorpha]BBN18856.1 hypothetical protein Mp_8g06080 [Marchantia polymorpha subsp. ruderalis]|eukprot:PTQ45988.1 hypothetical protein MARPO_0013s0182 [Marchantia polymorpha]